ncbi:MAG: hypothetical protein M9894_26885 [Planctomycetes bacterium]|nr:hypothetical protein [Planctomycetota bacterium]
MRAQVSRVDGARLVVARGPDVEAALRRGEAAAARLDRLVAEGGLAGYRSLRGVVPSREVQARALAHLADPTLPARLAAALAAEGIRAERLAPGLAALGEAPAPLTVDDVLASPLADLVRPFRTTLDGEEAVLIYLVDADLPRVEAALGDVEGVDVFDQRAWLARGQAQVRGRALRVVGCGVAAILLLVLWRHRRPRAALAAVAPALLAAGAALGLLALLGEALHLMHLVAALLVLCLGVDYGVFLAERPPDDDALPATLLATSLSCATTLLAFGLLALSTAPVLRAVGLTVGTGVLASLVLAPAAAALAHPRHASGGRSARGE